MQIHSLYLNIFSEICFLPWWLLAMLLPLLLGILIGYLIWSRYKKMVDAANRELAEEKKAHQKAHQEVTALKTDLAGVRYQLDELQKDNRALRASISSLEGDKVMLLGQIEELKGQGGAVVVGKTAETTAETSDQSAVDYAAVFDPTDLRLIEGIDPSIEKVLRSSGIRTFNDLAGKTPDQLHGIMKDAGPEYENLDTSLWIQQAKMADAGQWEDLIFLQKALGDDEVSKLQLYYAAKAGGDTDYADFNMLLMPDNLQVIEGVGPKAEAALKKAGIGNWSAVAAKSPEALKETLLAESAGFRILKTDTWPRQAELAAAGKWEELVEYQKFLDAGRDDTGDFDTPSKVAMMVEKFRKSGIPETSKSDDISYAGVFDEDNLQIVEGIGPKIEGLLKEAGINTWSALAAKSPEALNDVLTAAGPRYRIHNPASWPKQAKLAANGKWKELIIFQQFLDAGRENVGDKENPSKVAKLAMRILGFSNNPEDLTIVEGIGPKISELLKAAGIKNWSDLAAAEVSRLQEILTEAGSRFKLANPGTWPKQAELAAAGKWGELKDYQDFLQGGKDPNA
jgi:predicted flap endonuclease-1-like 5' DNA nuclease